MEILSTQEESVYLAGRKNNLLINYLYLTHCNDVLNELVVHLTETTALYIAFIEYFFLFFYDFCRSVISLCSFNFVVPIFQSILLVFAPFRRSQCFHGTYDFHSSISVLASVVAVPVLF